MRLHRKLIWLAIAGLVLCLAAAWWVGSQLSRSTNSPVADPIAPAVEVNFPTRDGISIAGTYWPGPDADAPAVLLLHGNGGSRIGVARTAEWLSRHGYAALAIDFRGHGESTSANHSFGYFEARDAAAALSWLKLRQGSAKVGVIGISLGGAAALIGEDGPLPADAMILQAVYSDIRHAIRNRLSSQLGEVGGTIIEPFLSYQSHFRLGVSPEKLSPLHAIARVECPILVIGGGEDRSTPTEETLWLYKSAQSAKDVWIVPGLGHNEISGTLDDAYLERAKTFFDANLQ